MYDCWNEALNHLIKTYGEEKTPYVKRNGQTAYTSTYKRSANMSDEDNWIVNQMKHYYMSIQVKKELYKMLVYRGIMEDKENILPKSLHISN